MHPEQIERLRDPALYPEAPDGVDILQTHLSVVCLAGDVAYKLKKAIRLPFADFSTREKRRYFCGEELRLNRRLCPGVYLDVVPLRRRPDGRLSFGGSEGEAVDWAVRMRRLPAERMLDVLLARGEAGRGDVEMIARLMAVFHARADQDPRVAELGSPERLRGYALANFEETRGPAAEGVFPEHLHAALEARTRVDFDRWMPTLRERARAGRIVDGHGDLHARNICLTDPVAIYDCIEFNPAFRCGDTALEHAFLAMDLRHRGHPELAQAYLGAAAEAGGDSDLERLAPPLLRYRAMVRAKVSAIAATETELLPDQREAARAEAGSYLRLAAASAAEGDGPWWIMLCGLPASGKSSLAAALADAAGGAWPAVSSDRIRKELAGMAPEAPLPASSYRPEVSRMVYAELRSRAAALTRQGEAAVILDANFREREERRLAREAAGEAGARLLLLRVDAPEDLVLARLDQREEHPSGVSDAGRAVHERLKAQFEPPTPGEADRFAAVSAAGLPEDAASFVLARWLANGEP